MGCRLQRCTLSLWNLILKACGIHINDKDILGLRSKMCSRDAPWLLEVLVLLRLQWNLCWMMCHITMHYMQMFAKRVAAALQSYSSMLQAEACQCPLTGKPQKPELQAPQLTRPASVPVRSPPKRPVTPTSTVGSQTGSQAALPAAPAVTRPSVVGGKLPVQPAVKPPTGSGQTLLPAGNPLIRPAAGAGALPKRNNPCECSKDGMSGGVQTGRPGCKQHVKGERFFCYVKDPANCPVAQASDGFPGAKIVPCADPCSCSATGKSGDVQTSFRGCAKHVPGKWNDLLASVLSSASWGS